MFLEAAGHDARKLTTIRYGLDELPAAPSVPTPAQAGVPGGVPLAVAVGRLIAQKDHATLLRAFALVRERIPDARARDPRLAGRSRPRRGRSSRELGLEGAVLLPGRTEIRDWLERADVFVHTSRWEGFGIVLLEAMLAGLPVVATRVSAVPEVVVSGQTGALVEAGDVDGVARELTTLLGDAELRSRLGGAGRERARTEFSVARMADRTIDVYEDVLGSRLIRA